MKITISKDLLLRIYIFVLIYSNALRAVLGKWGTLVADAVLLVILLGILFQNDCRLSFPKAIRVLIITLVLFEIIGVFEILNDNIVNKLYGLIEYRKSIFQMLGFFIAYSCGDYKKLWNTVEFTEYMVVPTILYGAKQAFFYSSMDTVFYRLQDAGAATLQYGGIRRAISIYSGPFHFGMICSLIFGVAIANHLRTKKKRHIVIALLCILGVYCSRTRTNYICCMVIFILLLLCIVQNKKNTVKVVFQKIIIFLTAVCCLSFGFLEDIPIVNSILNLEQDTRFMGRIGSWLTAANMIKEQPLIGYGMGSAGDTLAGYSVALQSITSHNMFIKIWFETGIVGLICLIIIFVEMWKICMKNSDDIMKFFFASMFAVVLLNSLVGSTISTFPIMSIFWIFVGIQATMYSNRNINMG